MAINFDSFQEGTTSTIQSDDYVVGFDTAVPGGERKFTLSTIANAVSGLMSTQLNNLFVERSNFTGTNQSLATSGYQKLPGGLIIQWGNANTQYTPGDTAYSITFPNSFPTACLNVMATPSNPSSISTYGQAILEIRGFTSTTLNFYLDRIGGTVNDNGIAGFYWLAIGY